MKKTTIVLALALALCYSKAHAAGSAAPSTLKGFNATKAVSLYYQKNTPSTAWAAASAHAQGDKEYATTSAYGGVAYKAVTPGSTNGTSAPSAPNTPTDSAVPTGYTGM